MAAERLVPHLMRFAVRSAGRRMNFRRRHARRTGDQPDPVHRRAAGGADLPDAVDHLLALHRAAGQPARRPTPRSCATGRPRSSSRSSADGRYAINRKPVDGRSVELLTAELAAAAAGRPDDRGHHLGRRDGGAPVGDQRARRRAPRRPAAADLRRADRQPLMAAGAPLRARLEAWLQRHWWRSSVSLPMRCCGRCRGCCGMLLALRRATRGRACSAARARWSWSATSSSAAPARRRRCWPSCRRCRLPAGGRASSRAATAAARDGVHAVQPDSTAAAVGDEPLLLRRRTGVPVWVGRRRADAARALLAAAPGGRRARLRRRPAAPRAAARRRGAGVRRARRRQRPAAAGRPAARAAAGSAAGRSSCVLYNARAPSTALPGALAARRLGSAVPLADWHAGRATGADGAGSAARPTAAGGGRHRGAASASSPCSKPRACSCSRRRCRCPTTTTSRTLPWPAGTPDVVVHRKGRRQAAAGRVRARRGSGSCD